MFKPLALLTTFLTIASTAALAQDVTSYTLDNGMDVVVIEDHRAPVVVHMVWYRSGSADEPVGASGVAHFLEHLLFKATDKMESGELSETVAANGGSDNAFTNYDYTAYFQRVAADRLPLMMEMEADRMNNLRLTQDDIETERQVILEERNQRTENNPSALAREQFSAAQFMNHRYGVPVIGWKHEMEELSLEDALGFYDLYYSPNNAILVVAGDVEPEDVRRLAETYYGPIPAEEHLPDRIRPAEPPQKAERRITYVDPRVSQPYVTRSYLAPERDSGSQGEAAALVYLAELLGGSPFTSVLGTKLQFETNTALFSGAGYSGLSLDKTTFSVYVAPADGVTLSEAEAAMDQAISEFMEEDIPDEHMQSIRTQLRASEVYAIDNVQGIANLYGQALTQGLSIDDVKDWPNVLQAVTKDDVKRVAKQVLDKRQAVTGWVVASEEDAK